MSGTNKLNIRQRYALIKEMGDNKKDLQSLSSPEMAKELTTRLSFPVSISSVRLLRRELGYPSKSQSVSNNKSNSYAIVAIAKELMSLGKQVDLEIDLKWIVHRSTKPEGTPDRLTCIVGAVYELASKTGMKLTDEFMALVRKMEVYDT